MSSCWDAPHAERDPKVRGYGHLPLKDLKEWASDDADLSEQFKAGKILGTSNCSLVKARNDMIGRIELAFSRRASSAVYGDYCSSYRQLFSDKLNDPGLLHNFIYFNVPRSDFMLMFYVSMWTGKMADAMIYLHNYGWDLKGRFGPIPPEDVWFQMSFYEAMNINERIKAQSVVDEIDKIVARKSFATNDFNCIVHATAFGGGNLPERFYGTSDGRGAMWVGTPFDEPEDLLLTVFDNGEVRSMNELYPEDQRGAVDYVHESFSKVYDYPELHGTQDLVWMHGLSMYLGPKGVPEALRAGLVLLKDGGEMMYDYIIMSESLRRCLNTQGWPVDRQFMFIEPNVQSAYDRAKRDVALLNLRIDKGKQLFEIDRMMITEIHPWGATSLRVILKKYSVL